MRWIRKRHRRRRSLRDTYLRALIVKAVKLGLNLTFVSDCLIQPKAHCPCPRTPPSPVISREERWKILYNPKLALQATFAIGYYGFVASTDLSHVDILSPQGEEDKTKTKTNTT
ncbi:hypothetical protein L195_g003282 [Trifolium pratense]|uniref:Uncharacterized protein n=1 Tax=Trifolium pratense TaxID=57577 RepID=A0A2K3NUU2_TRIPR|nr:hypothetical protein L195_g003282 [Trifolium pratense]